MSITMERDRDRLHIIYDSIGLEDEYWHSITDCIHIDDPKAEEVAYWLVEDLDCEDSSYNRRILHDFLKPYSGVKKIHIYLYPYCEVINTVDNEYGYKTIQGVTLDYYKMSIFCEANKDIIMNRFNSYIANHIQEWNKTKLKVIYHFHRRDGWHENHKRMASEYDSICNYRICITDSGVKILDSFEYMLANYEVRRLKNCY